MDPRLAELKQRLLEVEDLSSASAVLYWDQSTYMPPGGAVARSRQIGTLRRLAHEKLTRERVGRLLDGLQSELSGDSREASLVRIARLDYERAVRVPPEFTARFSEHAAASYQAWARARPADDFQMVRPYLERTVELSQELSSFFPEHEHIADPLIDYSDYGMRVSTLRPLFTRLREELVPLVKAIASQPGPQDGFLRQSFPEEGQLEFGLQVVRSFGYDLERGRQDKTRHPFMTCFSLGDVRITTRVKEDDLTEAMFSTFHEAGHALYYQGIDAQLEGTPLADTPSAGLSESQSRLWENMVGRSRRFWEGQYARLQGRFPGQLGSVSMEDFYRAINLVQPSLVRTDADEVTYNLHVLVRFELELALLEGRLEVRHLPESWREAYRSTLGILPADDRDGVLQDVHWYHGKVGGSFQGYTLGNILSAQIYARACQEEPAIREQISVGEFDPLRTWLTENVYRHGRRYLPQELIMRVTAEGLSLEPYLAYLREKYGQLYDL